MRTHLALLIAAALLLPCCAHRHRPPVVQAEFRAIPAGPDCPVCAGASKHVGHLVVWDGQVPSAEGADLPVYWCVQCGNLFTAAVAETPPGDRGDEA